MAFNVENLVVDHVLRVTKFDNETGDVEFTADQVENPSLECGGEQVIAADSLGAPIATFDRSKTSKFSAETSVISLGLLAAQVGSEKEAATADAKIKTPKFEIVTVGAPASKITLSEVPVGVAGAEVKSIYLLNKDRSISQKFEVGADAEHNFSVTAADKTITLPTGAEIVSGDRIAVWYEYESENAVRVVNSGNKFTTSGRFDVEVLFADVCNENVKYYGHIIFPKAKLDSNFTQTLTTDGKQGFSFSGMSDYCDEDKTQFYYVIPQ